MSVRINYIISVGTVNSYNLYKSCGEYFGIDDRYKK